MLLKGVGGVIKKGGGGMRMGYKEGPMRNMHNMHGGGGGGHADNNKITGTVREVQDCM